MSRRPGRQRKYTTEHMKWLASRTTNIYRAARAAKRDPENELKSIIFLLGTILVHAAHEPSRLEYLNIHNDTNAAIHNSCGVQQSIVLKPWNSGQLTHIIKDIVNYVCLKHNIDQPHKVAIHCYRDYSQTLFATISEPVAHNSTLIVDACRDMIDYFRERNKHHAERALSSKTNQPDQPDQPSTTRRTLH